MQLLLPGLGRAEAAENWIEICGEVGVVRIDIAAETGNTQNKDCPDCGTCLMCLAQITPSQATAPTRTKPAYLTGTSGQVPSLEVASNPAQFWHDGRGPPRKQQQNMTRARGAFMAHTQYKEVAL
ncbi:hypothetical protein [Pseudophaeobacter flagellatus]|uniref:hypothetical protein n=1 Tax=Pseudophaeobacter flagellatus TaxID=2899119 RepID=UPI001E3B63BD|nr:hypothetical protein [Pseudophaeobacter flagellatus]MCD9148812.1 hypothetical protein [Pseudophaeobacter flagellatus]